MPALPSQYSLTAASPSDRARLNRFLNQPAYSHRHLDWREPLDWLGRQPFWLLEKAGETEAVLACPPEPADVAWIRLFAVATQASPAWGWSILFERVLEDLTHRDLVPSIVSLALQEWFGDLLEMNHFKRHQDIIVLSYEGDPPEPLPAIPGLAIRTMVWDDLPEVVEVDNLAFESIWRLSQDDLQRAFQRSTYKTILQAEGRIIGYQMSALNGFTAHLARLAVLPHLQRQGLGYRLVQDLLVQFINVQSAWGVTLNTQDSNAASLALYNRVGFHLTGERFPVYLYSQT